MPLRIAFIILLLQSSLLAQKHEVSFDLRYGLATSQLKPNDPFLSKNPADKGQNVYAEQFTTYQMKSICDWGTVFNYKYRIWKKGKLYLASGIEFSQSKHYLPINPKNDRMLENVRINQERLVFRLGLNKKFHFFDGRISLDIGIHLTKRFYFKKIKQYSDGYKTKYISNVEYKYNIETIHDYYQPPIVGYNKHRIMHAFHWDYNVTLGIKLKKNTILRLGVSYTRNNNFYYDFTYTARYYSPYDETELIHTEKFFGLQLFNLKFVSVNHNIFLRAGVAYTFDSFKKKGK